MTTIKKYYNDPYTTEFSGSDLVKTEYQNQPAVVFPETYFYPTSGGQERDYGTINDCLVLDVAELDGVIYHVLDKPLNGTNFTAKIDSERRLINMQQHTGQHILSRAIEDLFNLDTVSSRLGENGNTIDLNLTQFSDEMIVETEKYANDVIWKHKKVSVHFADESEIGNYPLRSKPKVNGVVRIIEIDGYDFNACGGTHCTNTGEVGIIKITGTEKVKGNLIRLNFLCGGKALSDFQMRVNVMNRLSVKISANGFDILDQVDRMIAENKVYQKKISVLNQQILNHESNQLIANAELKNGSNFIDSVYTEFNAEDIRYMASKLAGQPNTIALLCTKNERLNFCFSKSADIVFDFKKILPELLQMTAGKGGGKSEFIQFSCDLSVNPIEIIDFVKSKLNG